MPILIAPVVAAGTLAQERQPEIAVDDELRLRPWQASDAPTVLRAFADPDIQFWHFGRYETEPEARAWIAECARHWHAEVCASWAVTRLADDEVVGRVAIYTALVDGYGEASYWVLPDARGHNIAARAAIAATRWAHDLGLHRVELQHSTANPASARVARKAGFTFEGVRRGANLHADGWHDMQLYSHLEPD